MRTLSSKKLDEVEALLERTRAMKGWLEVATGVRLRDAGRVRAIRRRRDEALADPSLALRLVEVAGKDCRRPA